MFTIIEHGPETPDPTQLDLFDFGAQVTGTEKNSTDSVESLPANKTMIRSPTNSIMAENVPIENGKEFELNVFQLNMAGSLHKKSRELVQKSKQSHKDLLEQEQQEEIITDLAR
jgi:hypothetical protein